MYECLGKRTGSKGCIAPPLLQMEISQIVLDELHLMLRISDILIRNMVWAMAYGDLVLTHEGKPPEHIDRLIVKIRECGISFNVHKHCPIYNVHVIYIIVHVGVEN